MSHAALVRPLAWLLLAGSLLLLACALVHPMLPLNGPGDLALIAATPWWRAIHLGLLHATGLCLVGLWARWCAAEGAERAGLGVAFAVAGIGMALNGVNIAFMTGAGTYFAEQARAGADVALVYEATHRAAVMCGRLAGFVVALAAGIIGAVTAGRAGEPRWLVGVAWLACGAGLVGNLAAPPGHPVMLTSVGLLAVWQAATAARLLRYRLTVAS